MKKSRFTDSQIIAVLKQAQAGTPAPELCREHGISSATFYKWRSKFGGMDASLMSQLKELQDENRRLKNLYAEAQLSADLLKEAMSEKMVRPCWLGPNSRASGSSISSRASRNRTPTWNATTGRCAMPGSPGPCSTRSSRCRTRPHAHS